MVKSIKRLGRGLDSLVSNLRGRDESKPVDEKIIPSTETSKNDSKETPSAQVLTAPINDLQPNPLQPRTEVEKSDIESLAKSIQRSGLLQPVAVREKQGKYEIIAGERRWHASKSIGMKYIPIVIHKATDEQMLELALIENIQREDLNAIDRALAYREFSTRFNLKPEEIGVRLGEDRTTVVNYLRLLDLPQSIQDFVSQGRLSMGHARCLLGVADDNHKQTLAESAIQNELSVRALEQIVQREKAPRSQQSQSEAPQQSLRSPYIHDLEKRFEQALRMKVTIKEGKRKGNGKITIEYFSLDDFDRIAEKLKVDLE